MLPINDLPIYRGFSHISDDISKIEKFTPEIKLLNHITDDFLSNESLQKKISNNEKCTFNIVLSDYEPTFSKLDMKQIDEVHKNFKVFLIRKGYYYFSSKIIYEIHRETNTPYTRNCISINVIFREKILEKKNENHEQENVVKNLNIQNSMFTDNRIIYPAIESLKNQVKNVNNDNYTINNSCSNNTNNRIMTEEKKYMRKNILSSDQSEFLSKKKQLEEELIESDNRNIDVVAALNDFYAVISQDDRKIVNKNEPITNKKIISEKTQDSDLERVNAELLKKIEQLTILSENQAAVLEIQAAKLEIQEVSLGIQNDLLEKTIKQEKLILQQAETLKDHDRLLVEQIKQERLIVKQAIKITIVEELLSKKDKLLNEIKEESQEIINLFECPINFEIIGTESPVDVNIPGSIKSNAFIVPSGQTYGPGIVGYLKSHQFNPVTNEPLTRDKLYPNLIVQNVGPLLTELNEKIKKGCS